MLKKINRITSRKEFEIIKKEGKLKQYPYFGLIFKQIPISDNREINNKKFGFIISKRISKKAVIRNKIKRLIAEEVRQNLDKFENGFRGIFLVKRNILDEKGNPRNLKFL